MLTALANILQLQLAAGAILIPGVGLAAPANALPISVARSLAVFSAFDQDSPTSAAAQTSSEEEDVRQREEELAQQARDQEAYDEDQRKQTARNQTYSNTSQPSNNQASNNQASNERECAAAWRKLEEERKAYKAGGYYPGSDYFARVQRYAQLCP